MLLIGIRRLRTAYCAIGGAPFIWVSRDLSWYVVCLYDYFVHEIVIYGMNWVTNILYLVSSFSLNIY